MKQIMRNNKKIELNRLQEALQKIREEYYEQFPRHFFIVENIDIYAEDTQASIILNIETYTSSLKENFEKESKYRVFDVYIKSRKFAESNKTYLYVRFEIFNPSKIQPNIMSEELKQTMNKMLNKSF